MLNVLQSVCVGGESNSGTYTDKSEGVFPVEKEPEACTDFNMSCGCIALWSMEATVNGELVSLPLLKWISLSEQQCKMMSLERTFSEWLTTKRMLTCVFNISQISCYQTDPMCCKYLKTSTFG